MTYSFEYISEELKQIIEPAILQSHEFDEELKYQVFEKAFVAPYIGWSKSIGCIIDRDGRVIKDSECIEWKEDAAFYDINHYLDEEKRVIFLGFLLTGFGHSYTDDLRKLWFVKTNEFKSLIREGYVPVFTTSWNRPIPKVVMDVFSLAGIDFSMARHITQLTRFEKVVNPDNCLRATEFGRVFCQEYTDLINCIKSAVPDSTRRIPKVYFTRTKFMFKSNKEYGEKEIETVFHRLGYEVIVPEDYSVIEQIQMVRSCDCFAATEGSVAHLSLFCKPNTNVAIICKANYLNFHQVMVNEFANLRVSYIEAHHSSKVDAERPWWGPFYLYVNHYLERFTRHPIPHLPYWIKFSYWEYSRNILYRSINKIKKIHRRFVNSLGR